MNAKDIKNVILINASGGIMVLSLPRALRMLACHDGAVATAAALEEATAKLAESERRLLDAQYRLDEYERVKARLAEVLDEYK